MPHVIVEWEPSDRDTDWQRMDRIGDFAMTLLDQPGLDPSASGSLAEDERPSNRDDEHLIDDD